MKETYHRDDLEHRDLSVPLMPPPQKFLECLRQISGLDSWLK